ncbi:protein yellow [Bradysia coprophila]|uniref:protein yellow n=1 Tax=Bradysia coprophila TaxID=38358 RepID=UPI00187DBE6C|nr:protein yellow [Bradysia coprophila]XP_037042212.1 protein yellow [Bradysia coprophila]
MFSKLNLMVTLLTTLTAIKHIQCNDNLRVAYQWNEIDFEYRSAQDREEAINERSFIPGHVVPVGLEVYKTRLFITLPRWKSGVPASLAYIDINDNTTISPKLKPYPSWGAHQQGISGEPPEIVSPFRVRADRCGRLWVLDTGVDDILGDTKQLTQTQLLIYDLHNDNLLRRYPFPSDQTKKESFFANIAVEDADCDDTYAYSGDLGAPGLVVYSWKLQDSWRVTHHYFHPDPLAGNYTIAGINFQWEDGLFGLALSKQQSDGFATLYFHPLSSTNEFSVSTKVLRNKTYAMSGEKFKEFKILGSRGLNGQSGAAFLDQLTGVLFYALPNLNAVACWKTSNREYTFKSQGRVYMSPIEMVFPNDVKVDDQDRLWVLSDNLQDLLYSELDRSRTNFRILTEHVKSAIENTACDTTLAPLPDIINRLGDILRPQTTPAPSSASTLEAILFTVIGLWALLNLINYN